MSAAKELLPSLTFEWNNLEVGGQSDVVVTEPFSLGAAVHGQLLVRVHRNDMDAGSPGLDVVCEGVSYCPDAPETTFVGDALATISISPSDGVGTLKTTELRWPWPALARLQLEMTQSAAGVVDNSVRVSAELVFDGGRRNRAYRQGRLAPTDRTRPTRAGALNA